MTTKFLYGKECFLSPVIKGEVSPRFSDLSHYARLENQKMRDDEMYRKFTPNKSTTQFYLDINGHKTQLKDLAENPILSAPTQHCYCLCLSGKGNDHELYNAFQADICIEINIDILINILKDIFSRELTGMIVEAKPIKYFNLEDPPLTLNSKDLVFYKSTIFRHEAEFRISLFYPRNKRSFKKADDNSIVPFFLPNESMFLSFQSYDTLHFKQCIVNVYNKNV